MDDVLRGTRENWKYPCSIMFRRYVSHLQSNYHVQARIGVQRASWGGHLPIQMIWYWCCPVHTWDVHLAMFWFAWKTIEPVESSVQSGMHVMDSIVLITFNIWCTLQSLCHQLSTLYFPLQLPTYEPLSLLDQRFRWDQAAEGSWLVFWEYLQVVVHLVHSLWVDH